MKFHALSSPFLLFSVWNMILSSIVVHGQHQPYYDNDYGDEDYYQDQAGGGYYYQDEGSNMYTDYVENKAGGRGGGGWGQTVAFSAVSWFLGGKIHSKRAVKKAAKEHKKQQQELYVQYYKDVLALQTQNAELQKYLDIVQKERIDADFEFADIDNDNRVTRAEFNAYKKRYLEKHPEMAGQFPAFEQFDPDHNGVVTKAEHDAYYNQNQ